MSLHTEHCLAEKVGDKGAAALVSVAKKLSALTTLKIDGNIVKAPAKV